MTTQDYLNTAEDLGSDCISDDSDYIPSSDSDSGDEIAPSPHKKKRLAFSQRKFDRPKPICSRKLQQLSSDDSDDELPLSRLRQINDFSSSDDEPLSKYKPTPPGPETEINEEELTRLLDTPMWVNVPFHNPDVTFKGETEQPPENLQEPIHYFRKFITHEMIDYVSEQTNLYSMQKDCKCIDTTKAETDLFIGLFLRMGLIQAYSVRAFWAEDTRVEKIADFMTRNRFQKLASHLHFIDNTLVTDETKKDKLWKLRPWLDGITNSLKHLPQEEMSAVDEIMVPFKGRSNIKVYMKNKPHKWGFKLWGRAGSSGTLFEFEIYQGELQSKEGETAEPQISKSSDVVLRMTRNIPVGQNFKVFADNYFTSLSLVETLKANGIFYVGTVRINRLKGCALKDEKSLKKDGRGAFDELVEMNSGAVAVRWFDNRSVDLLSSYIGVNPVSNVQRYDKKNKKMITVPRPAIVKEYNKFMGGIDLHDMLTALYRFPIRARRWYMYIFYHTLHMMVINAWLTYRKQAKHLKVKNIMKLAVFQSRLAAQLVAPSAPVGRPRIGNISPKMNTITIHRRSCPPRETRLDGKDHLPEFSNTRGRCKGRDCQFLTFVKCAKCQAYLCLNRDRNCYSKFHQ